jgi:hypothetical protein
MTWRGLWIEFKWGGYSLFFVDNMAVGPYRRGLRVGCARISEHGPHLLREGHVSEGGGDVA